jgi:tRNA nucleotidyltransferase (CCA-adding enzyme)
MQIYRVGGAVRDQLLGLDLRDTDWVVTGSSPQQMIEAGYRPIGKDFPVFLHPQSNEEYALARTERKVARGYAGFEFHTDPSVTIEQDLARRDLTINAIAEDESGQFIDPYNGREDIQNRVLRHVSPAFVEDPVRVLRVARFAARFAHLGFRVAAETQDVIRQIATDGELEALVPERVWVELKKALNESDPQVFFETLRDCDVLADLFPEVDRLFGVPQTAKYHPEVDTGIHQMMVLKAAARLQLDGDTRFAALCHDFGKADTPADILPGHRGHEQRGIPTVKAFCEKWRVPKAPTELALMTCEYHTHIHRIQEMRPSTILKFFQQVDIFRRPERFEKMTWACLADARGRTDFEDDPYPQAEFARYLAREINQLDLSPITQNQLQGPKMAEVIYDFRLKYLKSLLAGYPPGINQPE